MSEALPGAERDAPRTTRPTPDIAVGTPVLAFPATRDDRAIVTRTRSKVWRAGSFDLVSVEGYAGGIVLSHIEVLPTSDLPPVECNGMCVMNESGTVVEHPHPGCPMHGAMPPGSGRTS